jgi:hypothetical protein
MGDYKGAIGGRENNIANILGALDMFMEQSRGNFGGHKAI